MTEFKKGASRPECENTILNQIRKKITSELTYKCGSTKLEGARLESFSLLESKEGDFLAEDQTKWNCLFKGCGQIVIPADNGEISKHVKFNGYAKVENNELEDLFGIIKIEEK